MGTYSVPKKLVIFLGFRVYFEVSMFRGYFSHFLGLGGHFALFLGIRGILVIFLGFDGILVIL